MDNKTQPLTFNDIVRINTERWGNGTGTVLAQVYCVDHEFVDGKILIEAEDMNNFTWIGFAEDFEKVSDEEAQDYYARAIFEGIRELRDSQEEVNSGCGTLRTEEC